MFPGLPISHSKDLVHWELIAYGITAENAINFNGLRDSQGLYAPSIRYHDGIYYIVNTAIGCGGNFYITATNPAGHWSQPHWLKDAPGIDPSLFWDDDGRSYYVGQGNLDFSNKKVRWGVWLQEIDLIDGKLIGEKKQLTLGSTPNSQWCEGPHLYKIDGKYVLLVAEGGTGLEHSVVIFNSDELWGPYIPIKENPVITHRNFPSNYHITSTGHADLVQTQNGDWWSVLLAKRPYKGNIPLARETFLSKVNMIHQDGEVYPEYNDGCGEILSKQASPNLNTFDVKKSIVKDDFDGDTLNLVWNFLRTPESKWWNLKDGDLRMCVRPERINELTNPSFIARRIKNFTFDASCSLSFDTKKDNEEAGIIAYRFYNYSVRLVKKGQSIKLISIENNKENVLASFPYSSDDVVLKIVSDSENFTFYYGRDENNLDIIGPQVSISIISDGNGKMFNGAYVGMYTSGNANSNQSVNFAAFHSFEMR